MIYKYILVVGQEFVETMATSYVALHNLRSVLSFSCLVLMATTLTATNRTKLVVRLIHRDSIFPPPRNPNLTISYVQNHDTSSLLSHDDYTIAPLIPLRNGLLFLVNVSIGDPPVARLLAMDTGSSLTWIQRPGPVSCPKSSSTCTPLSCNSGYSCGHYWDRSYCGEGSQCMYKISYYDQSECRGIIALDKFTFTTSTGGITELHNLVFGYGLESHGTARILDGILGLQARNEYSLLARVGYKFSYCIGNIRDPHYMYNQLVLGEGAVLEGDSTPLRIKNGQYVVRLRGISVGEKQLKIDQNQDQDNWDIVIDSGSTLMLLKRNVYEPLKEEVTNLLDGLIEPVIVAGVGERPCYRGELVRDLKGFPTVTLHLDDGADLSLDVEGVFQRLKESIFCLAAESTTNRRSSSIIGILAQQYYNVGFDMKAKKVTFLNIECELLED